ncbi:MAG: hypothetical protein IKS70_04220, partial [Bacteroides sp.]|nr:hypothetical protein [Bacteroides sp.]
RSGDSSPVCFHSVFAIVNKYLPFLILLSVLSFAQSSPKDMADYCHALTGELEACKKYLIECEALQRDFLMR